MTLFCKLKTNIMFMHRFSQKYLTRLSVSCYCEPVGAMLCRSSSRHSPPPQLGWVPERETAHFLWDQRASAG